VLYLKGQHGFHTVLEASLFGMAGKRSQTPQARLSLHLEGVGGKLALK
jgi:hypothetical protein